MIDEGRALVIADVVVTALDSLAALPVTKEQQKSWARLERSLLKQRGALDRPRRRAQGPRPAREWWRDRGYPRAAVTMRVQRRHARSGSPPHLPRRARRVGEFRRGQVEGNRTISARPPVRKQVPIKPGTPYSAAMLERARLDLQELDIVRVASVDVPALGPRGHDRRGGRLAGAEHPSISVLPVRVQITEADRHLVSGDVGYVTDGGLSSQARWAHRNWSGGGRSLTLTGLAQTGMVGAGRGPDERYRLAISLKQPTVFGRRTSGVLTPFVEHRDDTQDRSTQYGLNTTLIYRIQQLHVGVARLPDREAEGLRVPASRISPPATSTCSRSSVQVAQGQLDSLGSTLDNSTFTLVRQRGRARRSGEPASRRDRAPAIQVTAPTSLSSTDVLARRRGGQRLPAARALDGRSRRGSAVGRLFPFGKSIPEAGDNPQSKFLQLRDVAFTAGGTGDARGWENRLLGPKVPDVALHRRRRLARSLGRQLRPARRLRARQLLARAADAPAGFRA